LKDDYFKELPIDLSWKKNVVVGYTGHNFSLMNKFRLINKKSNHIASDGLLTLFDIFQHLNLSLTIFPVKQLKN
jgi:hypothetical protein